MANVLEEPETWVPEPPETRLTRRMAWSVLKSAMALPGFQLLTAQLPALASGREAGLVISVKPAGPAPSGSSSIFTRPNWPLAVHVTNLSVSPTRQAPGWPAAGGVFTTMEPITEKAGESATVSKHSSPEGGAQDATSWTRTFRVPGTALERIDPTA